ncbi:MAG TPA: NADH-quinone oxidoreductase subunit NuoK [Tepidiformaceae bacterium]|jgi:NADH:ubiquinone oxidoreductase subunit K|nr:NADH-quinone oxidoreductase subunit NuoK [Thermoflexaceae bacterium]HMS59391.1 NADH-quinone oxidoreductase subunit NuoK [Tepidiformaceae bacterium]
MVPLENYLVLSAIIFSIGVYGVLARRNAVLVLMGVELMLNAVSLNFIAFSAYLDPDRIIGAVFAVFVITVAAAEVGLALAIVIRLYRNRSTSNVDEAASLKW